MGGGGGKEEKKNTNDLKRDMVILVVESCSITRRETNHTDCQRGILEVN